MGKIDWWFTTGDEENISIGNYEYGYTIVRMSFGKEEFLDRVPYELDKRKFYDDVVKLVGELLSKEQAYIEYSEKFLSEIGEKNGH